MKLVVGGFRFIDTSGCSTTHGPRRRAGEEVNDSEALDPHGLPKRGYEVVTLTDGSSRAARRADTYIFEKAEAAFRDVQTALRQALEKISVKVGNSRAVPAAQYAAFEVLRRDSQPLIVAVNNHADVKEANSRLAEQGKPPMTLAWLPGLHPELRLADPEDQARAERLQQSVAEAIRIVLTAVRSQDPDQIRTALDGVGALADSVADPELRGNVQRVLELADQTTAQVAARNRAAAAQERSQREESIQRARERVQASNDELKRLAAEAAQVQVTLSRWDILETGDPEELIPEERRAELWREGREARAVADAQALRPVEFGDVVLAPVSEEEALVRAAQLAAHERAQSRPIEVD